MTATHFVKIKGPNPLMLVAEEHRLTNWREALCVSEEQVALPASILLDTFALVLQGTGRMIRIEPESVLTGQPVPDDPPVSTDGWFDFPLYLYSYEGRLIPCLGPGWTLTFTIVTDGLSRQKAFDAMVAVGKAGIGLSNSVFQVLEFS